MYNRVSFFETILKICKFLIGPDFDIYLRKIDFFQCIALEKDSNKTIVYSNAFLNQPVLRYRPEAE